MKAKYLATLAAIGLLSLPHAAWAGWKLVPQGIAIAPMDGALTITPGEDWNRLTAHPVPKCEDWTLDGPSLNTLHIVSSLATGETLYRDLHKKDHPLPHLGASLQLTDIPDFVESSMRSEFDINSFGVDNVAPMTIAGHPGVAFSFHYTSGGKPLVFKGYAGATLVNNQLNMLMYTAPGIYYFDRDQPKIKAMLDSAKLK